MERGEEEREMKRRKEWEREKKRDRKEERERHRRPVYGAVVRRSERGGHARRLGLLWRCYVIISRLNSEEE